MSTNLGDRCENWAECYRMRMQRHSALSFEGHYRSPQAEHWAMGAAPPRDRPAMDVLDAQEINGAWQAIPDGYHQVILGAHYVRRWSPDKALRTAREFAGYEPRRVRVTDAEFTAALGMAHALLTAQLALPAVFRRVRLAERVRRTLDLEAWQAQDA